MAACEDKGLLSPLWESLEERSEEKAAKDGSFLSYLDEPRLLIAGVGGCGCRWISQLAADNSQGVELAVVDTDINQLHNSLAHHKLLLGEQVAGGRGTSGEALIGKAAAMESSQELRALFRGVNVVILTYAPGGGTGSGAAPVIAELARQEETFVVAMVPAEASELRAEAEGVGSLARIREAADVLLCLGAWSPLEPDGASARQQEALVSCMVRGMLPLRGEDSPLLLRLHELAAGKKLVGQAVGVTFRTVEELQAHAEEIVSLLAGGLRPNRGALLFLHVEGAAEQAAQMEAALTGQVRGRLVGGVDLVVTHRQAQTSGGEVSFIACHAVIAEGEERGSPGRGDAECPQTTDPNQTVTLFTVREPRFFLAYRELGEEAWLRHSLAGMGGQDFVRRLRDVIDGVIREEPGAHFLELVALCQEGARPPWLHTETVEAVLGPLCRLAERCLDGRHLLSRQEKVVVGRVPAIVAALSLGMEAAAAPARALAAELAELLATESDSPALVEDAPLGLFSDGSAADMLVA